MSLNKYLLLINKIFNNTINKLFPKYQFATVDGLIKYTPPILTIPFINYMLAPKSRVYFLIIKKKQVSHRRKRIRQIKERQDLIPHIMMCRNCGRWKLRHHLCQHCLKEGKIGKEYDIY